MSLSSDIPEVQTENVAAALRDKKQFILWKAGRKPDGRIEKVPVDVRGRKTGADNRDNWVSFDEACKAYCSDTKGLFGGIGFCFAEDDGLIGIDCDNCLDEDGKPVRWAQNILNNVDSYTEISPSGMGLKIIAEGDVGLDSGKKDGLRHGLQKAQPDAAKGAEIELFRQNVFFTITGDIYEGRGTVKSCQPGLDGLHKFITKRNGKDKPAKNGSRTAGAKKSPKLKDFDEDDVLDVSIAVQFDRYGAPLFYGDWQDDEDRYPSQSEADYHAMQRIAYYAGDDIDLCVEVFCRSKLFRKSKGLSYIRSTARKAIKSLSSFYEWETDEAASQGKTFDERLQSVALKPIPFSLLKPGPPTKWVWEGWVAYGAVTMFVGLWKAGKTTMLTHLLKLLEHGGDLGGRVNRAKVLYVTEESQSVWYERKQELGIGDQACLVSRPFFHKLSNPQWQTYCQGLADLVTEHKFDIVAFDPWQSISPIKDSNSDGDTMAAMQPLHNITETGAGVVVVHHPRKSEGGQGTAARGSGAMAAFVDIIAELRRFNPDDSKDTRRKLTGYGRYQETPDEVVVELTADGYVTQGTSQDVRQGDRLRMVLEVLEDADQPLTADEVRDNWPEDKQPARRTVQRYMKQGAEQGLWEQVPNTDQSVPKTYLVPE